MDKLYGVSGKLEPDYPFIGLSKVILDSPEITVKISGGCISAEYMDPGDRTTAEETIIQILQIWSFKNGIRAKVDLNYSWQPTKDAHKTHSLAFKDEIKVNSLFTGIIKHTIDGIIIGHDGFGDTKLLLEKTSRDSVLAKAIAFYSEEVIEDGRPMYGIYKALEAITKNLGKNGRKRLAQLAGESEQYVDDVMQTANTTRHAVSHSSSVLSEEDCKQRARTLIDAYANSL